MAGGKKESEKERVSEGCSASFNLLSQSSALTEENKERGRELRRAGRREREN